MLSDYSHLKETWEWEACFGTKHQSPEVKNQPSGFL
jgi:hypothetical protein